MTSVRAVSIAAALLVVAVVGCSADFDAGSTPEEQLCTLLEPAVELAGPSDPFRMEPLIEGGVVGVKGAAPALAPIALGYRAHQDDFDELGPYEPAIRFAAALADPDLEALVASATPSDAVRESARAIDARLQAGACVSGR